MNWDIFDIFAYRQEVAAEQLFDLLKNFAAGGEHTMQRFLAILLSVLECLGCMIFDTPVTPRGQALDLSDYHIVFEDEFDGDSLDTDAWFTRGNGSRRSGYNAASQVAVKDGNLVITGEYRDAESGEYGEGWYVGAVALNELYCKGYYEIRCKCNKGTDFWSAFWIQGSTPYDHELSNGGINSAEIDIFEAMSAGDYILPSNNSSVTSTIHCNGVDDDVENIDSCCLGCFKVDNDIYEEYNTYGLEWTDDEYIFYINGVESARSTFGKGVCQSPEQVIVSLEIPGNEIGFEKDYTTQFIVDYVKIYQKN